MKLHWKLIAVMWVLYTLYSFQNGDTIQEEDYEDYDVFEEVLMAA